MRTGLVTWAAVALLAGGVGCTRTSDAEARNERGTREQVNLPPRPDLAVKTVAEKYQDGPWSVEGLLKHARELVGKDATVRGTVISAELCRPGVPCSQEPFLSMVDDLKAPRHRLLVVSDSADADLSLYPVKSAQTLIGTVAMWSPNGRLINLDGILILKPPPPPTPAEGAGGAAAAGAPAPAAKK